MTPEMLRELTIDIVCRLLVGGGGRGGLLIQFGADCIFKLYVILKCFLNPAAVKAFELNIISSGFYSSFSLHNHIHNELDGE